MAEAPAAVVRSPALLTPAQRTLVEGVREPLRKIASEVAARRGADADELFQQALEVACLLAPEYRPDRGATFLTFVFPRARGAMLDLAIGDAKRRAQARAIQRAAKAVHETIEVGDPIDEDAPTRRARLDDARYALAAAAVIGQIAPTPEELFLAQERRAAIQHLVQRALQLLDDTDRQLVIACAMHDSSVAEAARQLGLGYDQAKYRFRVAMAQLGRRLGAPGGR